MSRIDDANETHDNPTTVNTPSCEEATRKELTMRSKLTLLVAGTALALATHTATAQSGGGLKSGLTTATTTSVVTVTIPGVVGIDIESDVAIDLGSYLVGGVIHADGTACPANTFPPPAGCTGAATYAATGTTTTAGAPGTAPTAGNIWMSVFCTKSAGTLDVQASVAAAWAPVAGPGFATTALRTKRSTANNTPTVGFAASTNLTNAAATIGVGTLAATFGWTRVDQLFDLAVPAASGVTFLANSYTTTASFTISKP
jgi:hypothetical protein